MNDTIEINNVESVISDAEALSTCAASIESVRESLRYILNEIYEYWKGNGEAPKAFHSELNRNVNTLEKIVSWDKRFAAAIISYSEAQQKQSQNVINL